MARLPLLLLLGALLLVALCCSGVSASSSSSSKSLRHRVRAPLNSTLVSVQVVSRHGTRAPNPVVDRLCPADRPNLALYGSLRITLAGLTGTGMKELYALGVYTRQQYIERSHPNFLSSFFNDQEVYFRAVGEDRTLQSAAAMGQGMYPKGTAPLGYSAKLASPVPVYTLPDVYDSLLEVRKEGCKAQLAKDAAAWDATKGLALYKANQPLLAQMHRLCNITDLNDVIQGSGDNYGDAIKDITDAWTFDMIEGFTMQDGINTTSLLAFRTLAVEQLLGRIVGTDQQVTYMNGELPERMLDNFLFSVWNQGPQHVADFALKMYAYHGHREMIYALGAFLGLDFDIEFPALPKGAIPPATTLFFELHYVGPRDAQGGIPNAFEAAGIPNPYAQEAGKGADALGERPLPWERRLRTATSASQQVREAGPQHSHHANGSLSLNTNTATTQEETKTTPPPAEDTALFGGDELSGSGQDAKPFNTTDATPQGQTPAESEGDNAQPNITVVTQNKPEPTSEGQQEEEQYKYLPRSAPKAARAGAAKEKGKKAPVWKPAPPMDGYVVRAMIWHPCADEDKNGSDDSKDAKDAAKASKKQPKDSRTPDCPAVPARMNAVCDSPAEEGCTLEQLSDAIHKRIARTGTWDKLCKAQDVKRIMAELASPADEAAAEEQLVGEIASAAPSTSTGGHSLLRAFLVLLMLTPLAVVGYLFYRKMREQNEFEYVRAPSTNVEIQDLENSNRRFNSASRQAVF